jgi:ribonuclease-3
MRFVPVTDEHAGPTGQRDSARRKAREARDAFYPDWDALRAQVEECLQYCFSDAGLLAQALTHASCASVARPSNERLEFLGDAVVGLVISDYLYRSEPDLSEGEMTIIKSAVVSRRTMARVGRALGLPAFLQVDEGLRKRKTYPQSIVANVYEAIVGAMFLDGGMAAAADFILRTLELHVSRVSTSRHGASSKSALQERVQAEGKPVPRYEILRYEGPEHDRRFFAAVYVAGEEKGAGSGATKKDAEQRAAREALQNLYPGEYE